MSKKNNKIQLIWFTLGILAIFLIIFTSIFLINKDRPEPTNNNSNFKMITERELYARLEAEFLCQVLKAEDAGEVLSLLSDFPDLADSHGYTLQEVEVLREKYDKDEEFADMALKETINLCPEEIIEANITNFTPRSPSYHET